MADRCMHACVPVYVRVYDVQRTEQEKGVVFPIPLCLRDWILSITYILVLFNWD